MPRMERHAPVAAGGIDLSEATLPKPVTWADADRKKERILALIGAFVRKHPDKARALQRECYEAIERIRPPAAERELGLREASRRTNIPSPTLLRHYRAGRIGEAGKDGKPKFSELECQDPKLTIRKGNYGKKSNKSSTRACQN